MKIAVEINLDVKEGLLPVLSNELFKGMCEIQKLELLSKVDNYCSYQINLVYSNEKLFNGLIIRLKKHKIEFKNIVVTNRLEDKINGGLLEITGKLELENINDYEINFSGLSSLQKEKISNAENPEIFTIIDNSIALVNCEKEDLEKENFYKYLNYSFLERDSIFFKKFSGYNAYPLSIRYKENEDLLKNLYSLENSFKAYRVMKIDDSGDYDIYNHIAEFITRPVLFKVYDEIPLYFLTEIIRQIKKMHYTLNECNIGFIGIDSSVIRLTRILKHLKCQRVLGYDNSEKYMMTFEKEGGMAITQENIFANCDMVFILKDSFIDEDLQKMRTGLYIYSFLNNLDINEKLGNLKECKKLITYNLDRLNDFTPALLKGMVSANIKNIEDEYLIKISEYLLKLSSKNLPDIFSDFHEKLTEFVSNL